MADDVATVREVIACEAYKAGLANSMAAAASSINENNLLFKCVLAAYRVAKVGREPTEVTQTERDRCVAIIKNWPKGLYSNGGNDQTEALISSIQRGAS